jgi:hypothetical protein
VSNALRPGCTALAVAIALLCLLAAGAGAAYGHEGSPHANKARGVVLTGLSRARPDGPCKTGFELRLANGRIGCTHGPDPAPPGRDVREPRSLGDIAAMTSGDPSGTATAYGQIVCSGDGVDGNRVQAVYAYPADGQDGYDAVAPYIRQWAAQSDQVLNDSAAETGGVRHVRYVTDANCQVDVAKVALTPEGIASLGGTARDLAAQGLDRSDRKYLVWVDAYVYCGVATVKPDDRAGQNNANNGNGSPGMVARVDRGCWGSASDSAEAHELTHILGGVQPTAPRGTWNYHCSDESELMCYDDDSTADGYVGSHGQLVPLTYVCPRSHERLLDCGGDDYFSANPDANGWLAQHWNVANSSFLTSEGSPSVPDSTAPRVTAPQVRVEGRLARRVPVRLSWTAKDADAVGFWLWRSVDGRSWKYVARPDLWRNEALVRLRRGHSYRFLVHAFDAAGNASPAVLGRRFSMRVIQERDPAVSYTGRWRRLFRWQASARHIASPRSTGARSRLVFRGKAIALVSPTSLDGGRVRIFIDSRYAGTIDLASATPTERQVVFSRRVRRGWHSIAVNPVPGSGSVRVDAFVVLR